MFLLYWNALNSQNKIVVIIIFIVKKKTPSGNYYIIRNAKSRSFDYVSCKSTFSTTVELLKLQMYGDYQGKHTKQLPIFQKCHKKT
jgi:hypothetical protein